MKLSKIIILALTTSLLAACTAITDVNSTNEKITEETVYKYYDSKSQIRYVVTNDEENLHISFKTMYEPTISKILRAGLTIYFDKSGKKKKDVYVNYPMGTPEGFISLRPKPGEGNRKKNDIKTLINSTSVAAEYMYFDNKKSFTSNQEDSGIKLSLTTSTPKELVYDIVIPFTKITPNGKADLFNLSVGIVTGSFNMPSSPQTQGGGGRGQGGGGRGQGGGGGGQRSSQPGSSVTDANYSGGGSGGQGGGAPHEGFSELSEESKIWFHIGLYR